MNVIDFVEDVKKYAMLSSDYKYRHGAVIFKRGTGMFCFGHNKRKHTPLLLRYGYKRCWLHAESDAILKSNISLKSASLLVVRVGKTKLGNSKPCEGCMALIREVGIKKVYYSDRSGSIVRMDV